MRCKDKSKDCQVTQVSYYLLKLKFGVRQRDLLHMNYHCTQLTGAGSISSTIDGDGCHATLFWWKSRNGGEV